MLFKLNIFKKSQKIVLRYFSIFLVQAWLLQNTALINWNKIILFHNVIVFKFPMENNSLFGLTYIQNFNYII